jgi:heme/copper-type cytochrome/quinol oxidase subunit 2
MDVNNLGNTGDKLTSQLRDAARTIGSMIAVVWLLAGIGYAILDPWTFTSELVIAFLFFLALSVGIAWWKEGIGGIMLVVLSVAFSIFACVAATHNRALAAFLSGVPFLIDGILFLVTWQRTKKTSLPDRPANTTTTGIDVQSGV